MDQSIVAPVIIVFTLLATYRGEKDEEFKEDYLFWTDGILKRGESYRVLTSGFLHSGWWHFGFNMISLYVFSYSLEATFGFLNFTLVYFASLIGGNLLALYFHRNHGDYRALGASGAVSGIILAFVVLYPQAEIGFALTEVGIKGWLFGSIFLVISLLGIKAQAGNIGHEAHVGGAIIGILAACVLDPVVALHNWWVVLLLLLPCVVFLVLVVRNPAMMMIDDYWGKEVTTIRQLPTQKKNPPTLDELLDKIHANGVDSLTDQDKKLLEEYQRKL